MTNMEKKILSLLLKQYEEEIEETYFAEIEKGNNAQGLRLSILGIRNLRAGLDEEES